MKKLNPLLLISIIILTLSSCSNVISGVITDIKKDTVTVNNYYHFKVYPKDSFYIGKPISFTGTVNRSKINSKKLK